MNLKYEMTSWTAKQEQIKCLRAVKEGKGDPFPLEGALRFPISFASVKCDIFTCVILCDQSQLILLFLHTIFSQSIF